MKKSTKQITYRPGRIGVILEAVCDTFNVDKKLAYDFVTTRFPELLKPDRCANCRASMAEYIYTVSVLDADLLCAMARVINEKISKGVTFHLANQVHLQTEIKNYTLASRMTISSKLGLIAKVMKKVDGKMVHDQKAGWLITKRGFDFLRGDRVPLRVKVFRNEIQERFEDTTTMAELYKGGKDLREVEYIAGILIDNYHSPRLL